jgi:hypothetical protein
MEQFSKSEQLLNMYKFFNMNFFEFEQFSNLKKFKFEQFLKKEQFSKKITIF